MNGAPANAASAGLRSAVEAAGTLAALADAHPGPVEPRLLSEDIKDVNHPQTAALRAFQLPQSPGVAMRQLGFGELVEFRMTHSLEMLRGAGQPMAGPFRLDHVTAR